ncbi:MAG: hypothetical protein WDZ49_05350, partial [Litorilinea sp.]
CGVWGIFALGDLPALYATTAPESTAPATLAPQPAAVVNGMLECPTGFALDGLGRRVPVGWILARADGDPVINSARHQFSGACENDGGHVEKMEGRDSLVIRARDLETPPAPGKPFDVVLYQQVPVAPDGDYSVSGWMLSLCGGSAVPSDCPEGVYIRKAIGLDPTGGIDPRSSAIVWTENLDNFVTRDQVRVGWANLSVGARAQSSVMTVFLRVHSPFQWHGNHAFIDAIELHRAPVAWFVNLPRAVNPGRRITVRWDSFQSPEIAAIPGGTYGVLVDVQVRTRVAAGGSPGAWQDLVQNGSTQGECQFTVGGAGQAVEFRLRARAEQPPPPALGAWPLQRFPGPWSAPHTMTVRTLAAAMEAGMGNSIPDGGVMLAQNRQGLPALYLPTLGSNHTGSHGGC